MHSGELTGDLALENVVANVSVTSPLVNATTKLVIPSSGSSTACRQSYRVGERGDFQRNKIAVSGDVVASSFRTPDPREITTVTAKNTFTVTSK
jgi:hypothetical protein